MVVLLLAVTLSTLSLSYCENLTVTSEVYFDIEIKDFDGPGEDYRGRVVVGVFGETCPVTALNFEGLAKGYKTGKSKLHYKNSRVHRVVRDFLIQMGDFTVGDGSGGKSIYGDKFNDENFKLSHRSAGYVSMANHGSDTNGSQFFITLTKVRWLDGKHVVFGKVLRGMDVVKLIGDLETEKDKAEPKKVVTIIDCGVTKLDKPFELTKAQAESDDDVQ